MRILILCKLSSHLARKERSNSYPKLVLM